MSNSPPTTPLSLYKAQLIVEKAKIANSKTGKTKKSSAPATSAKSPPLPPPGGSLAVNKAVEGQHEVVGSQADKENLDPVDSVNWVKCLDLTSQLLAIIEDSNRYRKAYGFTIIQDVGSGGATITSISREIAEKLLPHSSIPIDKLGKSVTNRVRTLKKKYSEYHTQLGQTGHGLIIESRDSEIISGTPIYNVWDKIRVKFPWYMRLYILLHGSPVVEKASLANSVTPLNTSVLVPAPHQPPRQKSVEWDDTEIDRSFARHEPSLDSDDPAGPLTPDEPEMDIGGSGGEKTLSSTVPPLLPTPSRGDIPPSSQPPPPTSNTPGGAKKRKDPYQQVQELTATYGNSRIESERIRSETKRLCRENDLKLQELKNAEQERQRQHEAAIIDKKILLAQLEARNLTAKSGNLSQPF